MLFSSWHTHLEFMAPKTLYTGRNTAGKTDRNLSHNINQHDKFFMLITKQDVNQSFTLQGGQGALCPLYSVCLFICMCVKKKKKDTTDNTWQITLGCVLSYNYFT